MVLRDRLTGRLARAARAGRGGAVQRPEAGEVAIAAAWLPFWENGEPETPPPAPSAASVALPVRAHGALLGALVAHTPGEPINGEDLAALHVYTGLAAALAASLSGEEEAAGRLRLDRLAEIARVGGSGGDARALLREVCLATARLCEADRCAVFLWNAATGEVTPATSQMVRHQVEPEAWEQFKRMGRRRIGEMPFVDNVARTGRPLAIADARGSKLVHQEWVATFGLKSVLGVPLISAGQVFGVLVLDNTSDGRPFTPESIELATAAAEHVASGLERALLLEETDAPPEADPGEPGDRPHPRLRPGAQAGPQGDLTAGRPGVRHGPLLDLPVAGRAVDPRHLAVPRRAGRRNAVAVVQRARHRAGGGFPDLRRDQPPAHPDRRQRAGIFLAAGLAPAARPAGSSWWCR